MQDYLSELNKEQLEAATTLNGYNLILAGAGSGKTKTIVARVVYMLEQSINPENILLLTFTNKAAKEMKERVAKAVGEKALKITACTFHSFCALFLRYNSKRINYPENYTIIDSTDMLDAISICMQDFISEKKKEGTEFNLKEFPNKKVIGKIYECAVNNCVSYLQAIRMTHDDSIISYHTEILEILKRFKHYKRERAVLDYEDLLFYTNKLLEGNEKLRTAISHKFKYISVDEYQDTNIIQNNILKSLSCAEGNLMVVGDDSQSIYAFRYANIQNILSFSSKHEDCKTIILNTNYRSTQEILDFANATMAYAREGIRKELKGLSHGSKPRIVEVEDCYDEADFIIDEIQKRTCPLSDIAVIARSAMQTYILEQKLSVAGIPYNKFGGIKFLEQSVVKDILAFLRIDINIKDEIALYRVLQLFPGIGKTYAQRIARITVEEDFDAAKAKYAKRAFYEYLLSLQEALEKLSTMKLAEKLDFLIDDYYKNTVLASINAQNTSETVKISEFKAFSQNLSDAAMLKVMAKKYRSSVKFLADLVLDVTAENDNEDKLNLTTIHSAKGLEYNTVFLLDCIEGITPKCAEGALEDSEELRCAYVAITRAKKELYIMFPQFYNFYNVYGKLSHFFNKKDIIAQLDIVSAETF